METDYLAHFLHQPSQNPAFTDTFCINFEDFFDPLTYQNVGLMNLMSLAKCLKEMILHVTKFDNSMVVRTPGNPGKPGIHLEFENST